MKIKFLTLFLTLIIFSNLHSQTEVSGAISNNTTWTKANSPYLVISNVLVQQDVILDIEAGVTVKIEENSGIVLRGTLNAIGEVDDLIEFIPNNNNNWDGIVMDKNFDPKIELTFVNAEKASVFIDIINTSSTTDTILKINDCLFKNNGHVIVSKSDQSHVCVINNSKFTDNIHFAFLFTGNSIIMNSEFHNCETGLYNNDQTITTIENCIFTGHDRAIAINGVVRNSEFYDNNRAIITMNSDSPELRYNYIHDNNNGIETWTYLSNNPQDQIKFNKICNNEYNIYQRYTGTSYVINNCWCTTDEDEIASKIYDLFDDTSLGIVEFSPIDSTCSFLQTSNDNSLSKEIIAAQIKLFPNPTNSLLTLDFQSENINVEEIEFYNSIGQSFNLNFSFQDSSILIDGTSLNSGWYIIKLKVRDYWVIKKFIKN